MDVAIAVRDMTRRCAHDRAVAIRDDREDFVYPRAIRIASIRIWPRARSDPCQGHAMDESHRLVDLRPNYGLA